MTLFTINFLSKTLHKQTEVNILLPANARRDSHFKTIWLLHGMTDDHTGWLRRSGIEVLAEKYGICAVMPNADLSFYVDMAFGADYFEFISDELPAFLRLFLPISDKKEDNYIAGVSMGGYGAFHTAMNRPERYSAAVSLSGPMRISWIYKTLTDEKLAMLHGNTDRELVNESADSFSARNNIPGLLVKSLMEFGDMCNTRIFKGMFGQDACLTGNGFDLFHLAERLAGDNAQLKLIAYCGEEDYHYASNVDFARHASDIGLDYTIETGSGGHEWNYWNGKIPGMLELLFSGNKRA
jgi:putative tributyrin esterase